MWLAATNGFSLGFKKGKPPVALPQARRAAMGKKQQPSPPSEAFVAADQLPAAEILAGELVSVVARNVESGRLSEHAISQAWVSGGVPPGVYGRWSGPECGRIISGGAPPCAPEGGKRE